MFALEVSSPGRVDSPPATKGQRHRQRSDAGHLRSDVERPQLCAARAFGLCQPGRIVEESVWALVIQGLGFVPYDND